MVKWPRPQALKEHAVLGECDFFKTVLAASPVPPGRTHSCDGVVDEHGWNALHFAAANGQAPLVEQLCKGGFNVDRKTKNEWTALHLAAYNNHAMVTDALLRMGCRTTLTDDVGSTAMELAEMVGNTEVVKLLYAREQKERREGDDLKKLMNRAAINDMAAQLSKEAAQRQQGRMLAAIEEQFEQQQQMASIETGQRVKTGLAELQAREAAQRLAIKTFGITLASEAYRKFETEYNQLVDDVLSAMHEQQSEEPSPSPSRMRSRLPGSFRAASRGSLGSVRGGPRVSVPSTSMRKQSTRLSPRSKGSRASPRFADAIDVDEAFNVPSIGGPRAGKPDRRRSKLPPSAAAGGRPQRGSNTSRADSGASIAVSSPGSMRRRRESSLPGVGGDDPDRLALSIRSERLLSESMRCFNRSAAMADEALAEEQEHRLRAWCATAPVTHPGEYVKQIGEDHKTWTCCGATAAFGDGCTPQQNPVKAQYHPGEFRMHLEDCKCSSIKRNMIKTASFLMKAGELRSTGAPPPPLSPRTLQRYRKQDISMFCSPGLSCWNCCGAHLPNAPGCCYHNVYINVVPSLVQPNFAGDAPNRRLATMIERGVLRVNEEATGVEALVGVLPQYTTLVGNPLLAAGEDVKAFVFEVLVEACGAATSSTHMSIGLVDEEWGDADSRFIGCLNSLGWWSNSSAVVGLGKREATSMLYGQGDIVSVLVDFVNKEVAYFTGLPRGQGCNRRLAALLPLQAMPDTLRPAVCMHSGTKLTFLPAMSPGLSTAQRASVREREKFFAGWIASRHRREEEERLDHIASRAQPELLPYIHGFAQ